MPWFPGRKSSVLEEVYEVLVGRVSCGSMIMIELGLPGFLFLRSDALKDVRSRCHHVTCWFKVTMRFFSRFSEELIGGLDHPPFV